MACKTIRRFHLSARAMRATLVSRRRRARGMGPEYAVLDTETTHASNGDRIIELGVVRVDDAGAEVASYETLLDPDVELGGVASSIHGVHSWQLREAPRLDAVWGDVAVLLRGAVPVAHN